MDRVHIETTNVCIRFYDEPHGFEKRVPYRAVMSASIVDGTAIIYGHVGVHKPGDYAELWFALREIGVYRVLTERHGKMKEYDLDKYAKMAERMLRNEA